MDPLIIEATSHSPEISFDPSAGKFFISGVSRPEDVRSFYYPVVEWLERFLEEEVRAGKVSFNKDNPLVLEIKLKYFNSSSAKFLFKFPAATTDCLLIHTCYLMHQFNSTMP